MQLNKITVHLAVPKLEKMSKLDRLFQLKKNIGMLRWGDSPIRHQGGGWCPQHLRRGPLWLKNLLTSTNPSGGDHGTSWNFDPIGTRFLGIHWNFHPFPISKWCLLFTYRRVLHTLGCHWALWSDSGAMIDLCKPPSGIQGTSWPRTLPRLTPHRPMWRWR